MIKLLKVATICYVFVVAPSALYAQAGGAGAGPTPPGPSVRSTGFNLNFGSPLGAGIVILGAGLGIGKIGSSAVESMSRQPEAAGNIQTAMIISAALIEGVTFFALLVCAFFNNPL